MTTPVLPGLLGKTTYTLIIKTQLTVIDTVHENMAGEGVDSTIFSQHVKKI